MYTNDALTEMITRGESDCVEFTGSIRDLDKIREAICGFANDLPNHNTPGFIFIGINDDGHCANLTIDDELLTTLGGLRDDGKIIPFPVIGVDKRNLDGCKVAVIHVEPSDNPPVKVDGRCWIRTGPRRAQATAEEERRLTEKRRSGNIPYDMQGVRGASVEHDVDMRKFVNEYLPVAVSPEVLQENDRDPQDQLQALRMTTKDRIPTVTGILIMGSNPSTWFPGAYIQFIRFAGNAITDPILDHKEIHGTLPEQLLELNSILKVNIRIALDTSGEAHIEKPDYPFEALRELSRNAVIHRNYENSNMSVKITWLADRIEIVSPGSTFGEVTRDNFGKGINAYRNPTIAGVLKDMKFMQRFGVGIAIARKALEENGNPQPEFDVQDTYIVTTIKRRP